VDQERQQGTASSPSASRLEMRRAGSLRPFSFCPHGRLGLPHCPLLAQVGDQHLGAHLGDRRLFRDDLGRLRGLGLALALARAAHPERAVASGRLGGERLPDLGVGLLREEALDRGNALCRDWRRRRHCDRAGRGQAGCLQGFGLGVDRRILSPLSNGSAPSSSTA